MFTFKQFIVRDERCGMKVGTDGTLLGAWASHPSPSAILDIGTGSGLVALMLAQRYSEAHITAIDIDADAAKQAAENFQESPWPGRLTSQTVSLQNYVPNQLFQLIVSNPPFFVDSLKNPDESRRTARHTDTLSFCTLMERAAEMLAEDGVLAMVLPAEAENAVLEIAARLDLFLLRVTRVCTKEGKPCKRILISFSRQKNEATSDALCLMGADGAPRSEAYQQLTNEFYL